MFETNAPDLLSCDPRLLFFQCNTSSYLIIILAKDLFLIQLNKMSTLPFRNNTIKEGKTANLDFGSRCWIILPVKKSLIGCRSFDVRTA